MTKLIKNMWLVCWGPGWEAVLPNLMFCDSNLANKLVVTDLQRNCDVPKNRWCDEKPGKL